MGRVPVRTIVEIALTIALAWVLNLIKVWEMPQGGSVSLVMIPIVVLALLRGPLAGITAGALYGLVDALWNPQVYHPIQFLLDYPVAFGLLGLAGVMSALWWREFDAHQPVRGAFVALVPGVLIAVLLRFLAHFVSGVVFFASFAGDRPVWLYSAAYNSFTLVAGAITLVAVLALVPTLSRTISRPR